MDDYGAKIAVLEERMANYEANQVRIESHYVTILSKLETLQTEISEARGGLRFGKWLAGITVAVAAVGVTLYSLFR